MTSLRKLSIVLLAVAAIAGLMAAPAQAQLSISCNTNDLPATLIVGTPYNVPCVVSGGTAPFGFNYTGSLPFGMSLQSNGNQVNVAGTPQAAGSYTFSVTVRDNNGNTAATPSYTWTVASSSGGTGSITLTSVSPTTLTAGVGATLTINGTGFTQTSQVWFNNSPVSTTYVNSVLLYATLQGSSIFTGTIPVQVHDGSAVSGTMYVTVNAQGTGGISLTQISPTSVPVGSAAFTLTLYGSGFNNGTLVSFGNLYSTPGTLQNGVILATIPAYVLTTAQTVNVSVGGSNSLPFTIGSGGSTGSLTISCTPSTGPTSVGIAFTQTCTVSGGNGAYTWSVSNLPSGLQQLGTSGSTISITGTPTSAQSYTIQVSDTGGHTGSVTFSVGGSGTSGYNITSVSPTSGAAGSATVIAVIGNGFTTLSQIWFNGSPLSTQYVTAGQLNATVPATTSAGTYSIYVNTNGAITNSVTFTVGSGSGSGISISSISPTSVAAGTAGVTLTIYGSGFSQGVQVNFGANSFVPTSITAGQITVFIPASYLTTSQTVNVTVGSSNAFQFVIGTGSGGTLPITCSPTAGPTIVNASYQQTCSVTGGTAPFTWTVSGLPTGVNQNASSSSSMTISGAASFAQSYSYTVMVTDSSSTHLTGSLTITGTTSSSSYNISSLTPSSVAVGSAGITLSVLGNGFNSSSLVYFNGGQLSTQLISATQLNATLPASFLTTAESVTVYVSTPGLGSTNSLTFTVGSGGTTGGTLTVTCTPGVGPATVGTAYSTVCTASGGNPTYNWPTPAGLPAYLSYSATTGSSITISGTPNVMSPYDFSVKVTDSSSPVQTGSLELAGQTGPASSGGSVILLSSLSPNSAPLNSGSVNMTLTGSGFSNSPASYVVFDGTPVSTTFISTNQLLATIPAGQFTFARSALVTVTTPGVGSSNGLSFIIGNGGTGTQISITCSPGVGPASPNNYYTSNCSVNGGTAPYTWNISAGALPTGLSLSPNGPVATIGGYTTLNGPYSYTLKVTDSSSPVNTSTQVFAGETGTGTIGTSGLSITSLSPASAPVGSASVSLTVNGTGFITTSLVYYNGSPLATTYVSSTQLTATIPAVNLTQAQNASVTVISSGVTSNALTFIVGNAPSTPISISCNPTTGPGALGQAWSTTCTAAGGKAPYNWIGVNPLPFGIVVTNSTTSTVQVMGTLFNPGPYNFSVQVTDSSSPALTATYAFIGSLSPSTSSTINSMSPISAAAGGAQFTLIITGSGFVSGVTQVVFNNSVLTTTVSSSTQLTAIVPASLIATPGNVVVSLVGTSSNTVDFFVTSSTVSGVSPSMLSYTYGIGGTIPPAQNLTVSSLGNATGFSAVGSGAADGINWLVLNQASSAIPGSISVGVSPTGLPIGTYSGSITLTGFGVGVSVVIPVSLTVLGPPQITPSPATLNLSSPQGGSATQTIKVNSSDGVTVFPYTATVVSNNGGNWLAVSPTTGTTPGSFTATATAGTLTPSTYSATITLTPTGSIGGPVAIPVTFTVTPPAALTVSPTSLTFTSQAGASNPAAQNISVSAGTNATVNYTVAATTTSGGTWLSATQSGTTPGTIAVSVNSANLAAGTYNGSVTITAPGTTNSPVTVPVVLTLSSAPTLSVSPTSLTFNYQTGGTSPAAQTLSLSGVNGTGSYNFTVTAATTTGGNWLSTTPTAGTTPTNISVSANPSGLNAGSYNGTLTITATGVAPLTVAVTLTVTSPAATLAVSPLQLTFNAVVSGSAPAAQTVAVSSSNSVNANYTVVANSAGNWLSVTPGSGTTPSNISVSVNQTGLAVGQYNGTLVITSPGATNTPYTMAVALNVTAAPAVVAVPGNLSFLVPADGSTPAPQSVTIISTGANTAFTTSAVSQGNWLTVGTGGTTPASVAVTVNPTGLLAGQTYNGSITINAPNSNPNTIEVPVSLTLAAQGGPSLQVAPQQVYLSYTQGAGADLQHVAILNNGSGTINFTAQAQTANCGSWLFVATPSGTATASSPGVIAFNVNPSGLNSQTCRGSLMVNDGNGNTTTVPVYMAISGQTQSVLLSQTAMNFVATASGAAPAAQTFQILNPGSGSMQWTITTKVLSGSSWLSVAPTTGSSQSLAQAGSPISVSVNAQGLAAGTYFGSVQVTSTGALNSPQSITVSLTVLPSGMNPSPQASPNGVIITGTNGTSDTQTVTLSNGGANSLTYGSAVITDDGQSWLTATPATGTVAAGGSSAIQVSANLGGVSGGLRHGTLRIAFSDGSFQTVDVQLAVSGTTANATGVGPCGSSNLAMEFLTPAQNFQASARGAIPLQVLVKDCSGNALTNSSTGVDVLVGSSDIRLNYAGNGIWSGNWTPASASPIVALTARAISVSGGSTASGAVALTGNAAAAAANAPPYLGAVVNAGSFLLPGFVGPGTMVSAFGSGLADGQASVSSVPFPNALQGSQFNLRGLPLSLFYASDGQVNGVVPIGINANERDQLIVIRDTTQSVPVDVLVADVDPGIFATNQQGTGQGAILVGGTAQLAAPAGTVPGAGPAAVNQTVSIFLAGLGVVSNPPADGSPSSGSNPSLTPIQPTVTIGGVTATVTYSGLAPGEVGLYQINVVVPAGVPTGNAVPVVVNMGNGISNTVTMAIM